jgi:guanylate kinase
MSKLIVTVSGPSGSGKTSIVHQLCKEDPHLFTKSISYTTRPQRQEEQLESFAGRQSYIFVSREQFQELQASRSVIAVTEVFGNLYGVPSRILALFSPDDSPQVIFAVVTYEGAEEIEALFPGLVLKLNIYAHQEECMERIVMREPISAEDLSKRLETYKRPETYCCPVDKEGSEYNFIYNVNFYESCHNVRKRIIELSQNVLSYRKQAFSNCI